MSKQRVLVTGKGGQLATELQATLPSQFELVSLDSSTLDITDLSALEQAVTTYQPTIIINAAAYTAVDKAESDVEAAYSVNELGTANLAQICSEKKLRLVHISTDFVFDGKNNQPYTPEDAPAPLGVYGRSKFQGERRLLELMPTGAIIVRTAWVYSEYGSNFVKSMLRLMTEKEQLGVVYDQVGTPTWAKGLANAIWAMVVQSDQQSEKWAQSSVVHWTDAGVTSWYDFAIAIQDLAFSAGLLNKKIPILPIKATAYPTPAVRPYYGVLDKASGEKRSGMNTIHWQSQLKDMIVKLAEAEK
ncbi:dTDP-4-dehydrorhamnose reductase [Shewanella waksmanii]|uniref:dTDP-4-dehydrorhamnose reductase n=1 Tax=Shewanella waksmanii TaxID=213783 RepID=UPI0037354B8F